MEDMTYPLGRGPVIVTLRFERGAPHERVEIALPQSMFDDPPMLAGVVRRQFDRLKEATS